jgi:anthranilate phosphoribosyltransferase
MQPSLPPAGVAGPAHDAPHGTDADDTFRCAHLIKEIGRGARGARALSREDTEALFTAVLDNRVDEVALGALLMAYRIKGETPDELAGMLAAAQTRVQAIAYPSHNTPSALHGTPAMPTRHYRPVSIPSYNGARKMANFVPLLAALLAQRGVPVVVHGVRTDPGRVTSAAIFGAMGLSPVDSADEASGQLHAGKPVFMPIDVLSPGLDRLLRLRARMGVRNSAHTLVKLLDVFAHPAGESGVRLVNYTHPPYRDSLAGLFQAHPLLARGDILLARGTEGEAVADVRRQVQIDRLRHGVADVLVNASRSDDLPVDPAALPLPDAAQAMDAHATADWIAQALADPARVPASITRQVEQIVDIAAQA